MQTVIKLPLDKELERAVALNSLAGYKLHCRMTLALIINNLNLTFIVTNSHSVFPHKLQSAAFGLVIFGTHRIDFAHHTD